MRSSRKSNNKIEIKKPPSLMRMRVKHEKGKRKDNLILVEIRANK